MNAAPGAGPLTHVVFRVSGVPAELAAFDARLKLLLAEHRVMSECAEQHSTAALHYDMKVAGGIPFPPFALASGEFPALTVTVEWVDMGTAVRGTATIAGGKLSGQNVENFTAASADHAVAIRVDADGYLALALAVIRTGREEYRGYMLTGAEDALFLVDRDPGTGAGELFATRGAAEWARAWSIVPDGACEEREIDPAQPIPESDFRELEKLAQDFVSQWVWFAAGAREEIAIEVERYERLGYAVTAANLRSAALHRIRAGTSTSEGEVRYSTLPAEMAWVEETIARCWPQKVMGHG